MKNFLSIEFPARRNFGLDLLRFFAIIFVLIGHSGFQLPKNKMYTEYFCLDGVALFFVLSGFLIGGIFIKILENRVYNFREIFNFWMKRWMRTIPAYFFVLTIIVLINKLFLDNFNLIKTIEHYLFLQNFTIFKPYIFNESWSLSIEEWFYLTLPILTIISSFFFKNKKYALLAVVIIVISFSLLLRYYRFENNEIINNVSYWDERFRSVVVLRLDSIMFGVLAAWLKYYYPSLFFKYSKTKLIVGIFLLITLRIVDLSYIYDSFFQSVMSFTINSIAVFLIIPYLFNLSEPKNKLLTSFITYTSLISYSLYLTNSTLLQTLFLNKLDFQWYYKYILFWPLTFFISTLIYKYVETPFMKLRDKYFK